MARIIKDSHTEEIRRLISSANECLLAVAFWGKGAIKNLGINKKRKSTKVICDLDSGACNPDELHNLLKLLGPNKIKSLDGLHAKLYWTDKGIVLGSSNASANGLGFEGTETTGNAELNVLINDPKDINVTKKLFDEWWVDGFTVNKNAIDRSRELWGKRRDSRCRVGATKLSGGLFQNLEVFRDKNIWFYSFLGRVHSDESCEKASEDRAQDLIANKDDYWEESRWSDPRVRKIYSRARQVLEIKTQKGGAVRLTTWKTLDQEHWYSEFTYKVKNKGVNVYCRLSQNLDIGDRKIKITPQDREEIKEILLSKKLQQFMEKNDYSDVSGPLFLLLDGTLKDNPRDHRFYWTNQSD